MIELNLPVFDVKVKQQGDSFFIWDRLRRKYVSLTPEEWVRQHFVNFLIENKNYPESRMVNEQQIVLNGCRRRCDSVVYNEQLNPIVIVEYKAPDIKITQDVFDQIARYNIVLKVSYLIVSNGLEHYCCEIDYEHQQFRYLPDIPSYTGLQK